MHAYTFILYTPVVTVKHVYQPKEPDNISFNKHCTVVLLTRSGQGEYSRSPRSKGQCALESGEQCLVHTCSRQVDPGMASRPSHLGRQNCCPKSGFFYPVCNKPVLTHSGKILFYSGLGARWTFHKSSTPNVSFFVTFIH